MLMTPKQYIPQSIIGRNLEYYSGITSRQNQQGGGAALWVKTIQFVCFWMRLNVASIM